MAEYRLRDWFMVNPLAAVALGTGWIGSGLVSAAAHVVSMKAQRTEEMACASSTK